MNWGTIIIWGNKTVNRVFYFIFIVFLTESVSFSAVFADKSLFSSKLASSERESVFPVEWDQKVFYREDTLHSKKDQRISFLGLKKVKRDISSKKIRKTKLKRDRSFKVPKSKIPIRKKKRLNLRSVQPPSSTKLYYATGSDEAELENVINEEIKYLFKLLKKNRTPELILRLGSLYVEKSRLISVKIQSDYEKQMAYFKAGQRKTKPHLNLKTARVYNTKSLKLFEDFRFNYPKHKRMDEVLFFLGFNFYQLGREKQGIQYFSELEKKFPKSIYLYEARFQLGEHYFQLRQWKSSFSYYSKVAKNKKGKFYFFALYKMAWSAYKMRRASQGLGILERIIKEGREFQVVSDRNRIFTFTNEAVEDLVLFYTYSKKTPAQAKSFFLGLLEEEKAWALLKRLAYAYRDTSQVQGVFTLFDDLIQHNPVGEEAFEYKYQIVEAMYNSGRTSEIVKQINEWVRDYGPKSSWFQANKRNPTLIKKSLNFQEVTVRNYALKNHEIFRRSKSGRSKALSLSFYKIYFDHFKNSSFLNQMSFFYAELLFDSGKYISAIKSYEEVISQFPNSKYAKPAYINQILALEKALPKDTEIQKLVGKESDPVEFPSIVKNFVKAANRYTKKFPRENNIPSILYRMAALYYKFNQFSMAAKLFKKMSDEYPTSKLASNVGGILLDIYSKNKDYKSLEELALKLSQNKNVDKELLNEVNSVLEQISFKKAQDLALKKKYRESAELYEKFARSNPSSPLAPSAFYNAGLNFERDGDRLTAISMYSAVLTYKGAKHRKIQKKSQEFLAILYEKLGFYRKAANAYVSFAKLYPSDSKSSDFWYNAGVIFDALNDTGSTVFSYKKYFQLSKKPDRHEIFYLIGLMYEKNRRWQKAIANYSQYLKSPSSNKLRLVKASFTVADIFENQLKNSGKAHLWHKKTLALHKKLGVGVSYGARSHFYIAKNLYNRFSQIKIPADTKKQEAVVARKLRHLRNLENALKPVIRYNDGEQIIASLCLIGEANQEMAKAIYETPIPKGLDKKGKVQYRLGIKKLIEPYIKKSVKHYQLALNKSDDLKIYSPWIRKAHEGLASIQLSNGKFKRFLPHILIQEPFSLHLFDNTGTVVEGFIDSVAKSFQYGVSRSDFEKLSKAIAGGREENVLNLVSSILNKDPNNIVAINSLALFYMKKNRWKLGTLVLNRISSQKSNSSVIMNNLAIVSLKYGKPREALAYLKKAIELDKSYSIARINLANIFIQQLDYRNAYSYYKGSYDYLLNKWPSEGRNTIALMNNYSIALTGMKNWKSAEAVFKNLTNRPSPASEILFNYAVFLTEKSKIEGDRESLLSARELANELALYEGSKNLKRKVKLILNFIENRLKSRSIK